MQKCRGSLSQSGEEQLELTHFGCDVSLAVTVLGARGVVWEGHALAQIWSKLLSQTAVSAVEAASQPGYNPTALL